MSDLFPYHTVITFPVQTVNPFTSPAETIQLIMSFGHAIGADRNWNAADYDLKVLSYGQRKVNYDLEDGLIIPSQVHHIIADPSGVIEEMVFGTSALANVTGRFGEITIKINGVVEFIGNILEDTVEYNESTKTLEYSASPKIDIINKTFLYDKNGDALNPFGKVEGGGSVQSLAGILEDVYGLVNSAISFPSSLIIDHLWKFRGIRSDFNGNVIEDIDVAELEVTTNNFYFDNTFSLKSCGDLLRKLAIDWGACTGMLSNGKAFFKKLFYYNGDDVQIVNVHSFKKGYGYSLIDYVAITNYYASTVYELPSHDAYTEAEGRYLERKLVASQTYFPDDPPTWSGYLFANCARPNTFGFLTGNTITTMPALGDTYSNNGSTFEVVGTRDYDLSWATACITGKRISGTNNPDASGTLTRVSGSGDASIAFTSNQDLSLESPYRIIGSKDDDILSGAWQLNHADLVANFWWKWRGNQFYCRVDKFILRGITYDFLKSFNYNGSKYQPISMIWNDAEGYTECEAIYLGEL